jgi:hypothetical protein
MIKLYLASFLEPSNFGTGRIISIANTNGGKPKSIKVDSIFEPFTPNIELIKTYNQLRAKNQILASQEFVIGYTKQLDEFFIQLQEASVAENTAMVNLLPFKNSDTLASWERANFTNYRKVLAPYLLKIGFSEVVVN